VFWELTSLTSFLLIGFSPEREHVRRQAQQGLLVTVAGGLALLAGVILLGSIAGTFSVTEIVQRKAAVAADPLVPVVIVLIAAGAFAKSAQFPLHSWLANAMVAPTPVSAFLHSATMVKLGVYLLARLNPLFEGGALWSGLLLATGSATMLAGTLLALRETDLKRVLAYSTIVSLGTLVVLVGLPHPTSAVAFATFLIVHALYKACLFLVAGIIDHEAGTRDTSALGGLRRAMPITAVIALLGGLSMAGLPPFVGFVAKELVYQANFSSSLPWLLGATALMANSAMVVVAGLVTVRCFFGTARPTPRPPADPGPAMWAGPAALAAMGLLFGIAPWLAGDYLVGPAASAVTAQEADHALALWHGFTPMLGLSLVTLALGVAVFLRWEGLRTTLAGRKEIDDWGPDAAYGRLLDGLQRLAIGLTERIQSGSLRNYLATVLAVFATAAAATLLASGGIALPVLDEGGIGPALVLPILLCAAALAVVTARNFIVGIVAAGTIGFSMALLFLFWGAPDLAFTQFSVEALAMVILLAIVGRVPFRERDYRDGGARRRDAAIAIGFGVAAALVMLAVIAGPFDERISDFYRVASVPEANGRNLVNVIIVDFRALDTLGEITVLGFAAIAAGAVLATVRRERSPSR
jgi:multicomponent Na+:H+ antiporter subunit A